MQDSTDFTSTLRAFMARARRSNSDLAQLTGISINTIEKWTAGIVRRPRFVADVLKLARALALDAQETTTLLIAAGHPPLETVRRQAQQTLDPQLQALLDVWAPGGSGAPDGAARSAEAWPGTAPLQQLRPPIADFVGRRRETAQLVAELRAAVTEGCGAVISGIHGMGGIGKTELAYQVAHQLRDLFPDARLLLPLRGTSSAPLGSEQALQRVIRAFAPEERLSDELDALQARYQALLHGRRVLILADDARDAAQARALLPPLGCALLVTSRRRFTLPGIISVDLEQLGEDEAVALLRSICERLSAEEAAALARGCGALPLALRISSSMLRIDPALSVAAYLERLTDERQRLSQLRDPEDAQLDVEASLSLSYAQLEAAIQQVFRQLGVLVADFATTLAQAVVAAPEGVDVEATLHLLLRRNLVMYDVHSGRWRLHDLVRALALGYLEREGEREAALWRYAREAVQIAQELHDQYLAGGEGVQASLARFDAERSHIDAAWAWGTAQAGMPDGDSLLVAVALATTHLGELRYDAERERIPQLEQAQEAAQRLGQQDTAGQLLLSLGRAAFDLGAARRAIWSWNSALAIFQALDDPPNVGRTLGNLGNAYARLGDPEQATGAYEQALAIFETLQDRRGAGHALGNLGAAYAELGDLERAIPYLEQSLIIARELGDRRFEGQLLHSLGELALAQGDPHSGRSYCEQALAIAREVGDRPQEAYSLTRLGCIAAFLGERVYAAAAFAQALAILQAAGDRWGEAECGWHYGQLLAEQGDRARALPLLRASVAYAQEIGHRKAAEHAAVLARLEGGAAQQEVGGSPETAS